MENRQKLFLITVSILLSCGSHSHSEINAQLDKDNCELVFNKPLIIQQIEISQSTMFYSSKYVPINSTKPIKKIGLCTIDTNVFKTVGMNEHNKFNPNKSFFIFIKLEKTSKITRSFYRAFIENGFSSSSDNVKFSDEPMEKP